MRRLAQLLTISCLVFGSLSLESGGFANATTTVAHSVSWSKYFKICKPILVNQYGTEHNNLYNAVRSGSPSAMRTAMNALINLAGKEISHCTNSGDKTLNGYVNSQSIALAAAMIVGEEWLDGKASDKSFEAGLKLMNSRYSRMLNRYAYDVALYG